MLHRLTGQFLKNIADESGGIFTCLPDKFILTDGVPATQAGGTRGIVHITDFCAAVYDEVMTAGRTLKRNITHNRLPY